MARTAYGTPDTPVRTGRSAEYEIFARVTRRLRDAAAAAIPGTAPVLALVRALHENQRLWTTLAVDVADDGNGLPRDLRARLFYLAEFTRVHSARVMKGEASAGVLVDINTAVMRGLAQREGAP